MSQKTRAWWVPLALATLATALPAFTGPAAAQSTGPGVSINELMPLPGQSDPVAGQWIELKNLSDTPINVQGLVLMTSSLDGFHTISPTSDMTLEPGALLVMGPATQSDLNGGAPVTYAYGNDIQMNPQADMVFLMKAGRMIDYVTWGSSSIQIEQGFALSREPGSPTTVNWCRSRASFGAGDHGTPGEENTYCDDDLDTFSEDEGDCDDTNSIIRPGGVEACNGLDENCNGLTDDGVTPPDGVCPSKGVCASIVPVCVGAAGFICPVVAGWEPDGETLCDGLDNDCDGLTDELLRFNGLTLGTACTSPGECGSGAVVCSPDTLRATCSTMPDGTTPKSSEEICDGLDNDCDGFTDEGFRVGEKCSAGLGACARSGTLACDDDGGARCLAEPGNPQPELCGDRIDNNCDGLTDEGFETGVPCRMGTGACAVWSRYVCAPDMLDVTCPAVPLEPASEICDDLIDNDCNGFTDESGCRRRHGGCSATTGDGTMPSPVLPLSMLTFILIGLIAIRAATGGMMTRDPRDNRLDNH
ncbi:MAG TPA: MopE-related protein [Myxococcota bacterium]|nr:MopE-related protein [Myxococcota bacterium]HOC99477.1 MopE-related protein [Myxococcota bacterium]HOH76317.1 MopE-related protein [Myxococcota bacterium]HPV02940.1 MopE-related protein [Myxococcota bacterium]